MAVGVTILLSLAVFFLMVEEKMPVSEDLPLIGKYYSCTIIEVSVSLAAMCYVLRYVHHRSGPLPHWRKVSITLKFKIRPMQGNTSQSWILDSTRGFRIPSLDSNFFTCGTWIVSRIPDSLCCILNSKGLHSGFHNSNFPHSGIRISLHGATTYSHLTHLISWSRLTTWDSDLTCRNASVQLTIR